MGQWLVNFSLKEPGEQPLPLCQTKLGQPSSGPKGGGREVQSKAAGRGR